VETEHLIFFRDELEKDAGLMRRILLGNVGKSERLARIPGEAAAAVKKEIMSLPVKNKSGKAIKENMRLQGLYKLRGAKKFKRRLFGENPIDDAISAKESAMVKKMELKAKKPFANTREHLPSALSSAPTTLSVIGGLGLLGAGYGGIKYRD